MVTTTDVFPILKSGTVLVGNKESWVVETGS
jgi:hypothetical protein